MATRPAASPVGAEKNEERVRRAGRFTGGPSVPVLEGLGGVMVWEDVTVQRRATSPVLIGRAAERGRLENAFRAACDGVPVTVLIAGEAGIGKTRLVNEFAHAVAGENALQENGVLLGVWYKF